MSRLVFCVAALVIGLSTAQWIETIDGQNFDLLLSTKFGTENPVLSRFLTIDNAFRPLNSRTIYRGWDTTTYTTTTYPTRDSLIITGEQLTTLTAWIIPYTPEAACTSTIGGTAIGSLALCSTISPGAADNNARPTPCRLDVLLAPSSGKTVLFALPLNRLSMNVDQAALICVQAFPPRQFTRVAGTLSNIATNLVYQVTPKCSLFQGDAAVVPTPLTNTNTSGTFVLSDCPTIAAFTGLPDAFHETVGVGIIAPVPFNFVDRTLRTVCCGYRPPGLVDQGGNSLPSEYGLCINPNIESCCASNFDNQQLVNTQIQTNTFTNNVGGRGKPYNPFEEKCCYGGRRDSTAYQTNQMIAPPVAGEPVVISYLDDTCPCEPARVTEFCGATRQCCTFTKYPELIPAVSQQVGRCFDPNTEQCCETGETYNPGFFHCCVVNGVQSLDVPCPCDGNEDCRFNQTCCQQLYTTPVEVQNCGIYSNYPTGTGPVESQSCLGRCIDTRFQICCNGYACVDAYETCCNTTCCNKFSNRCTMERARVTPFENGNSVLQYFEVCTTDQSLTPIRAVMAFLLPIALLLATFLGLAFSLFFAKRQNQLNPISGYEKAILTFAFLIIFFGWPLYFSPLYRYGVVIVWTGFFSIVAALAGIRGLVLAAAVVQLLLLVYIFDPFGGNELLNLAHTRAPENAHGAAYTGIFLSINALHRGNEVAYPGARCTAFYAGWFVRTPLEDPWVNPPNKFTFGFCAREWFGALLIIEIINTLWIIILFLVTIVAHIKNVLVKKVISQNPLHF